MKSTCWPHLKPCITGLWGFMVFFTTGFREKYTPMVALYDISLRLKPENINVVQLDVMVICDLEENASENVNIINSFPLC